MRPRSRIALSILSLIIISFSCSTLTTPLPETQPPPPEAPPATDPPPQLPVETSKLPAGLVTATENTLILYDLNGEEQSRMAFPQLTFGDRSRVHIAGPMPPSGGAVPILFLSFGTDESLLFRDGAGQIFVLQNGTGFLSLTGVPGQPIVSFSQIEFLDVAMRSNIYVGSIQTLSSAAPIIVIDDPEFWAVKPILVEASQETPTKIWYTRFAYGIGGDIVFEPRKALFVLDIPSGIANKLLEDNLMPWDISNDRVWVSYSAPDSQTNRMCIKNLQTSAELCFPTLPASESRGAGGGYFSPAASYIAWMEGEGWQMAEVPNFKATVRVGQINGAIVADLPMNSFEAAAGIGPVQRAEPVAWLDDQTVVIQVRGDDWDRTVLVRYNVISRETTYLAPGNFVGLMYP